MQQKTTSEVTTGTAGGTVSAAGGQVTLVVPAGAVATPVTVTVAPVSAPPANPGLVANTTFDFGPNGTTFAQPVQLTIEYDPADIPSGIMEADLLLQAVVNSVWQPVPGSTVDEAANTVTGSINSFSEYGIAAAPMPSSPRASGTDRPPPVPASISSWTSSTTTERST